MPNDTDHQIRVVAEKFMGWKSDRRRCLYHDPCDLKGRAMDHPSYREIPPPNLLEPQHAWELLVALTKRCAGVRVFSRSDGKWFAGIWECDLCEADSLPAVLLDAAYQLATKEQR